MSGKKENVQSSGITRRDFVKGLAIGAAGLGIATILPGGIITAASAADTTTKQQVGKQGDGWPICPGRRWRPSTGWT